MPLQDGSYCIQREFHDFKEESDFSSVLRRTLAMLSWDRQTPKIAYTVLSFLML